MTIENKKRLAYFLIFALFLLFIQVALGGITRLTGSGLSITKWDLVVGSLPPLSAEKWQAEFDLYKATPQYELLNEGMSMSDFKFIYFWEWFHRFWGRLGFLFLFALMFWSYFKLKIDSVNVKRFGILLFLYFLQGVVGIFMVYSGLVDIPRVSHYRLATHLIFALFLFGYILWWIVQLVVENDKKIISPSMRKWAWGITAVMVLQIVYGAFMSGLRAAGEFPSWPMMNGEYIPSNLYIGAKSLWFNLTEHKPMVQFIHRHLAYFLSALLLYYWWRARKLQGNAIFKTVMNVLPIILVIQVALGITTLLNSSGDHIPVFLGVAHQLFGLLLLSTMLFLNFQYHPDRKQHI